MPKKRGLGKLNQDLATMVHAGRSSSSISCTVLRFPPVESVAWSVVNIADAGLCSVFLASMPAVLSARSHTRVGVRRQKRLLLSEQMPKQRNSGIVPLGRPALIIVKVYHRTRRHEEVAHLPSLVVLPAFVSQPCQITFKFGGMLCLAAPAEDAASLVHPTASRDRANTEARLARAGVLAIGGERSFSLSTVPFFNGSPKGCARCPKGRESGIHYRTHRRSFFFVITGAGAPLCTWIISLLLCVSVFYFSGAA